MPPSRLYHIAEEGKRSDDYVPRGRSPLTSFILFWRGGLSRFRRRRILSIILVVLLLYFFWAPFHLSPHARGASGEVSSRDGRDRSDEMNGQYYDGPIGFPKLAYTIYSASWRWRRNNVLFAVASLQSASAMVPIACEMARYRRNAVHFMLLGRHDISIEELLSKNGVGDGCDVHWHDGRPSHSVSSTEFRMETSVFEALRIVSNVLNLQVLIVNNLEEEDKFFVRSIRTRVNSLGKPVIEFPKNAAEDLMWMTRLDCGSLRAWNNINIEIIVQVGPGESGSLIRLLKSMKDADYFSSPPPGVTIELPPSIDKPTLQFLEGFAWPPSRPEGQISGRLRLRRRFRHDTTAEEASIRFLESFSPADPSTTHILILSPRVELSPLFYHYLKYALLEHKYSSYGFQAPSNLVGIALNLPSTHPNSSLPFNPPLTKLRVLYQSGLAPEAGRATPFLWQAPDNDAALYFGEKWVEFQEFLSARLDALRQPSDPLQRLKATRPKYPLWMGYLSEFLRARGYLMLYPNWESGGSFATVHNDSTPRKPHFIGGGTNGVTAHSIRPRRKTPLISRTTLVRILPADGDLPELSSVPILSFDGHRISPSALVTEAAGYAADFRKEIGGCDSPRDGFDIRSSDIGDLFCLNDD